MKERTAISRLEPEAKSDGSDVAGAFEVAALLAELRELSSSFAGLRSSSTKAARQRDESGSRSYGGGGGRGCPGADRHRSPLSPHSREAEFVRAAGVAKTSDARVAAVCSGFDEGCRVQVRRAMKITAARGELLCGEASLGSELNAPPRGGAPNLLDGGRRAGPDRMDGSRGSLRAAHRFQSIGEP